ncbi:kinesin-like protein KIN-13B [Carya illinoinensis]|uniref:kinesin-like protein KIN-13B n=1 Tax=Carya illinoinensis TaxID=32201 RepID=UPI001C71DEB7|nr:kinesin-like protein KIN-13B [Carya illinoinensis]
MNGAGRQGQRSAAAGVHHQRQYSGNFLDNSSNDRWLQSTGLQHLHSSSSSIPHLQDHEFYGGGGDGGGRGGGGRGSMMYRNGQSGLSGGNEFYLEPSTPPGNSRSRKNGEDNEFSLGLLDLHSFNTEFLTEVGLLAFSTMT